MNNIIWSIGHTLLLDDILKADNCYLYDSKGNKYIDLESGVWCTNVGHCNPRINNAIKNQLENIYQSGFNYVSPIVESSAQRILEITNLMNGKCVFLCSGSEAIEFGVRIVNSITSKSLRLTFSDSYFGAYGEASNKDNINWLRYNWLECSCTNCENGCVGECKEFAEIPFGEVGLFLFEPGSSLGLVRFPSKKLITAIISQVKANNGLIMINEVTTGVGRTGKWFGYQHYDIEPDIIAMGKGIGNGYPVSVTVVSQNVSEQMNRTDFRYAQSHQNDPLGAAVVEKVIEVINDEKLIQRSDDYGNYFLDKIEKIKDSSNIIKEVRGRGLMIAIELNTNAETVQKELLKRKFIVAKRFGQETLRLDPALTIKENDIDLFLATFKQVLRSI